MTRPIRAGVLPAAAVASVGLAATLGEGGATPDATLAVHLALGLLVLAALLAPRGEGGSAAAPRPAVAFGAFALWVLLGAVRAPYAFGAWLVVLEIASFAAAFWLAVRAGSSVDRLLPPALAAGGAVHGAWAVAERLAGDGRPATTFLNPNHLGAWLAASALVATAWTLSQRGPRRVAGGAAAAVALAGLAATGSRGALAALVAGFSTLVALRWRGESRKVRAWLLAGGVAAVVGSGVLVASRLADADPYHWERLRIWKASLGAVVDDPWFGSGPGQFPTVAANLNFAQDDTPLRFGRTFRSPHSDVLRLWVEFGWPAALAALAAGWFALREIASRLRAGRSGPLVAGALAALSALAAQSIFDDLTTRPALVVLAAVLAARVLAREDAAATRIGAPLRAAAGAALLILLAVGECSPWLAWRETRGLPRGRLDAEGFRRLEAALERNPLHPDAWTRLAEHEVGDGSRWDADGYARAREAAETAIRLQPTDATVRRAAAWVEGMACRTLFRDRDTRERAAARYREAAVLARHDATIPVEEARFLLATGDPEGARRAAERALRVEPRAAVPRVILAEALLETDPDAAATRVPQLLLEAERWALADPRGVSSYEARLRRIDPDRLRALREGNREGLR